jgi:UDP-3-O-[3-hydroxymyristoyl] glucosamine N-acyltransferase
VSGDNQVNQMTFTISEIAKVIGGEVVGDANATLKNFTTIEIAQSGDLTFAENEEFFARAEQSNATAIIADKRFSSARKILIQVPNARVAFAKALALFFPEPKFTEGIHPTAVVAKSAQIDSSAHIGPHCVVGERVKIGARSILQAGNFVGDDSQIGHDTNLFSNATIYPRGQIGNRVRIHANSVVGSDGYGYVLDNGIHRKVPQIGNVIIGDDVEIGASVTIDRGALGSTVIGAGTKIDNLVHVAHNVVIGRHCLIMGQVGFAGSTQLGDYSVIASQSGIAGHLKLGAQSTVGAKSGVMRDIPAGGTVLGIPAMADKQAKRQWVAVQQLPEMVRRMRALENLVAQLAAKLDVEAQPGAE